MSPLGADIVVRVRRSTHPTFPSIVLDATRARNGDATPVVLRSHRYTRKSLAFLLAITYISRRLTLNPGVLLNIKEPILYHADAFRR